MDDICYCGSVHDICFIGKQLYELAKIVCGDPRVVTAEAAMEAACLAKQENQHMEFKEWAKLDKAWRDASVAAQDVFSAVWQENAERMKDVSDE